MLHQVPILWKVSGLLVSLEVGPSLWCLVSMVMEIATDRLIVILPLMLCAASVETAIEAAEVEDGTIGATDNSMWEKQNMFHACTLFPCYSYFYSLFQFTM